MKINKKILIFNFLLLSFMFLTSCVEPKKGEDPIYLIPSEKIVYTGFEFGNVIQDGKQAVFFSFTSPYLVSKIRIIGTFLDFNGNELVDFENAISFTTPSNQFQAHVRVEKEYIKKIKSVNFIQIEAYTKENIVD